MGTRDFLGREWDIHCMGCAIRDGSMLAPGGIIQRSQYFCVHQDPLIPIPGFLVIASLRHIHSISDMQDVEYDEFTDLLRGTHTAIKKATGVEHLTLVQEENSIHFHLWFFPWTRNVLERFGQPSLTKMRDIMLEHRKQPLNDEEWRELEESIVKIKNYF